MQRNMVSNAMLSSEEKRDIMLWFGWGAVLGYPTGPRAYLREAMKPDNKLLESRNDHHIRP